MSYLQSVSIITALPIGIVIVMIAISFLKDIENSCKKIQKLGELWRKPRKTTK